MSGGSFLRRRGCLLVRLFCFELIEMEDVSFEFLGPSGLELAIGDREETKLTSRSFMRPLTVLLCSCRSRVPRGSSNRASIRNSTSLNVH